MYLTQLKIALRNIFKHKISSIVNVFGLAIGLASFILILLYVVDELSYDKQHKNADSIYRLVSISDFEGVGEESASAPFPVAPTLVNEFPGMIERVVRLFNFQAPRSLIQLDEKVYNERRLFFADSNFFQMFDYNFIYGDPQIALNEAFAVVITKETAEKYFGRENPMGKLFRYEGNFDLKVTGVIDKVPSTSHFTWDFMVSMSSAKTMFRGKLPETWVWNPCWTYIQLKQGVKQSQLEAAFPEFVKKFYYDASKTSIRLYLQKLTDIHLFSHLDYEIEPNGNNSYVHILSTIAIFLLMIATINFMNLSTATSGSRTVEIGMKKVIGAERWQLVAQFLGEALIISFLALLLALLMVEIGLPYFNVLANKQLSLSLFLKPLWFFVLFMIGLLTGLLSGLYPAFYLSSFQPLLVLKGHFTGSLRTGLARKILVVIQFTISIGLIVSTLTAFDQLHFLRNANLGFNKDAVVFIQVTRNPIIQRYESFKNELLANPDIKAVTCVDDIFGVSHNTHEFRPEGVPEDEWQFYPALIVDEDFIKTFDIQIVAGRDYNRNNKTDAANAMLINEAMVKYMGWGSNENAIGKKFKSLGGEERVIGVFKDFNATSLHTAASPFVLNIKEDDRARFFFLKFVAIRIVGGNYAKTMADIEKTFNQYAPGRPFEYSFLSDELNKQYIEETRLSKFSLGLTLLIIFVAGLGLFGLVSYMIAQRNREICIRLTVGAGLKNMFVLFSKEYLWLIILSNLIAWPVSWLMLHRWLENFAYHINLSIGYFVVAGLVSVLMTLSIILWRTTSAIRSNPLQALRWE
ncbi:MAG: FtsX-like permease family protein [Bacteroidales bacterium]|nr:FtsX-like permease family protein [Bacteroidales bacterium]